MIRTTACVVAALAGMLLTAGPSQAEVYIRAPFFRLRAGRPGVYIRVPFVNINIPRQPKPVYTPQPSYRRSYTPPTTTTPPPTTVPPTQNRNIPPVPSETLPMPKPVPPKKASAPNAVPDSSDAITLQQFSKAFKPREGLFEVDLINPVTNKPATVRFALPQGTPRVQVGERQIEFRYGLRRFVRIEFDEAGAIVTSR